MQRKPDVLRHSSQSDVVNRFGLKILQACTCPSPSESNQRRELLIQSFSNLPNPTSVLIGKPLQLLSKRMQLQSTLRQNSRPCYLSILFIRLQICRHWLHGLHLSDASSSRTRKCFTLQKRRCLRRISSPILGVWAATGEMPNISSGPARRPRLILFVTRQTCLQAIE